MKKKKKVVSSASVHMYSAHSTRTASVCVCVGRGWEETEWRREAQIPKHKYLQRVERDGEEEEAGGGEEGVLCDAEQRT